VEEAVVIYDFYLNSAVERYGLDVVGKQRIGRELLPIWAKIGDEIVKAHYIKKLASILGVDEEDVRAQIKKASPLEMKIEAKTEEVKRLKPSSLRREVLEEYVVGLLVGGDRVGVIDERLKGLVQNSYWGRVVNELAKGDETLSLKQRIELMPAELRSKVMEMVMGESVSDEDWEGEWEDSLARLEELDIREKIEKWQKKPTEEKKESEFLELSKKLAELTRGR
jgi:DNA primase